MLRLLAVLLCWASWAAAQERTPILTDDGQPVKVIIGTSIVTPSNPPRLATPPAADERTASTPEILPYPRILAVDEAAKPKRVGLVTYLLGETMAYVAERRQQVRPVAYKTLGEREPALLNESIREGTSITPVPPQELLVKHTTTPADAPHYTTAILQQMVAIIAAVIVLAFVLILTYFFVLRKYAPFTSLFQVQVIGATGMGTGVPFVPAALANAESTTDPFADVVPNFELGPTYEEEMALKNAASERQELAVLEHIANLNAAVQSELKQQGYLSDEAPTQSALETLTNPEPAV